MKKNSTYKILTLLLFFAITSLNAQDIRVIDNKGTLRHINKVTYGTNAPTSSNPSEKLKGDIYIVGNATTPEETYLFDGANWVNISSNNNWSLTGNTGTTVGTNFLGTIDNQDLSIKTNNIERIKIGEVNSNEAEILINQATPNSSGERFPLIIKGNGNTGNVLRLQNANKNENWDFNARNGRQLELKYYTNSTPSVVLKKSGNVAIGGSPSPELSKLDVFGKLRVRDLPEFNPIQNNAKLIFVTDDGNATAPNNVLKKTLASNFISNLTQTVTSGNEIAEHTAGGTTTSILETVTNATDTNTASNVKIIATYTNENGTNQNIEETVTRIEQISGSSTPAANPISPDPTRSSDSPGDIKYYNESTPTTPTRVRVVSTDTGNALKIGSDGGAYYVGPRIVAAGRVSPNGTCNCFNSSVTKVGSGATREGKYIVTYNDPLTNVVIQLTKLDNNTARFSEDTNVISYQDLNLTSKQFQVNYENSAGNNNDGEFMFTIITW